MIFIFDVTADSFPSFRDEILHIEKVSFLSPWTDRSFTEELYRPVSRLLAMKKDTRLVGYLCYWSFAGEIHLMKMAIDPEARQRGLGFSLLARMIDAGRLEKAEKVWLEVRVSNAAARSLYKKAGFKEVGRRRGYYTREKEDAVVMALTM